MKATKSAPVNYSITPTTEGLVCLWEIAPSYELTWTASSELPLLYDTGCSTPIMEMELEAQGSRDLTILLWNEVSLYTLYTIKENSGSWWIALALPSITEEGYTFLFRLRLFFHREMSPAKCLLSRSYSFPLSRGLAQLSLVLDLGSIRLDLGSIKADWSKRQEFSKMGMEMSCRVRIKWKYEERTLFLLHDRAKARVSAWLAHNWSCPVALELGLASLLGRSLAFLSIRLADFLESLQLLMLPGLF